MIKKRNDQNTRSKSSKKSYRFVLIPKSDNIWYDAVKTGAEKAGAEYEQLGIKINIEWNCPPTIDYNAHLQTIKAQAKTHPDGLAIACISLTTDTRLINSSVRAGLNVVTFDTDAPDSLRKTFIGHTGNYQDGAELGEFLAKKLDYTGRIGLLTGTLTAPNHIERVNGFKDTIEKYQNIQIAFSRPDNDDLHKATQIIEKSLGIYSGIKGFFCSNATGTIGCARAVQSAGKAELTHIVGMDNLPETTGFIKTGVIDAVKAQNQQPIGYWTIKYLVAINQGEVVPKQHPTDSRLITQETL